MNDVLYLDSLRRKKYQKNYAAIYCYKYLIFRCKYIYVH
jgi:hypothetical protein